MLFFAAAISGKLCAAAADMNLVEYYAGLQVKLTAKRESLIAAGKEELAAFAAEESRVAEQKRSLYSLNLDKVADVLKELLVPSIQEPDYAWGGQPEPKSLVYFLGSLREKNGLSLTYKNDRPDLNDQINPIMARVTARLVEVLPALDGHADFNGTLSGLCNIGTYANNFMRMANAEVERKSSHLRDIILLESAEAEAEADNLQKVINLANSEKGLLARVVEAFEELELALKAAGRMS